MFLPVKWTRYLEYSIPVKINLNIPCALVICVCVTNYPSPQINWLRNNIIMSQFHWVSNPGTSHADSPPPLQSWGWLEQWSSQGSTGEGSTSKFTHLAVGRIVGLMALVTVWMSVRSHLQVFAWQWVST